MKWRTELSRLIQSGRFSRQGDLVKALADQGSAVNQSSVSRELGMRGVQKVGGVYQLPSANTAPAPVHDIKLTAFGCVAVIRTDPAFASVLGQFIDETELDGVIGTVSGDDTVFVAMHENADRRILFDLLGWEH